MNALSTSWACVTRSASWPNWAGEPGFTGDFAEYIAQKFPTSTASDFAVLESGIAMAPRGLGTMVAMFAASRLTAWFDERAIMAAAMSTLYSRSPWVELTMLLSCTVIGKFSRPAKTSPKMKSFQMPVTWRMTATVMIGTAIGSITERKMRQKPAPSTRLYRAALDSSATIGGRDVPILFLGLTPGFVGLAQANLQLPADAATGTALELVISVNRQPVTSLDDLRKVQGGLKPGDAVAVTGPAGKRFLLPQDPSQHDYLFLATGTGIAPFMAFLQERKAAGATGRNWLFFGDQKASTDFLYREELESWQKQGVLHKLSTAFSRDQAEKIFSAVKMKPTWWLAKDLVEHVEAREELDSARAGK
mgnify:CR=1 FL=1